MLIKYIIIEFKNIKKSYILRILKCFIFNHFKMFLVIFPFPSIFNTYT